MRMLSLTSTLLPLDLACPRRPLSTSRRRGAWPVAAALLQRTGARVDRREQPRGQAMAEQTAKLALEDGTVYTGRAFGAAGERFGEVVFNTSMTGYQEVLTDPSYTGQIVCMTYPLIGNYGVNEQDRESAHPRVEGFIVRECARTP